MPSPSAVLALARWENALISAAGVALGAWWAGGDPIAPRVVAAAAAAAMLAVHANAYNDVCDREIDAVAHPRRPLPSGQMTTRAALGTAIAGGVLGIALSAAARPVLGLLSVAVVALMVAYNRGIKRRGLPGNLLVAGLASFPFLYGAWAVGRPRAALALMALAVPLHLAREIAKDLEDAPADAGRRRTLPVALGPRGARWALVAALVVFAAALARFAVHRPLFALVVAPAIALTALGMRRALRGEPGGPLLFKTAMVCAMVSLVVAPRE